MSLTGYMRPPSWHDQDSNQCSCSPTLTDTQKGMYFQPCQRTDTSQTGIGAVAALQQHCSSTAAALAVKASRFLCQYAVVCRL
jgi:hypothetical protein